MAGWWLDDRKGDWLDGWVDWLWYLPRMMTHCSFWPCCNIMGYTFITYNFPLGYGGFFVFVFVLYFVCCQWIYHKLHCSSYPHIPIICACKSLCNSAGLQGLKVSLQCVFLKLWAQQNWRMCYGCLFWNQSLFSLLSIIQDELAMTHSFLDPSLIGWK